MDGKKIAVWLAGLGVALMGGLLILSGIQLLEHQKTIGALEKSVTELKGNLKASEMNLKSAKFENESLNRVILLQSDLKKDAEKQRQVMTEALQQLQVQLKQSYAKLPKPVANPVNYEEPKEDLQRSFQRLMVIWDAYCKASPDHPNCGKEKPL